MTACQWRPVGITWSEVLRLEHTSQYPHTTSSKRILSLDESVLTTTRLQLGYHGDAFYHSQVYSEGAIMPGRVMSLMTGRQEASPRNCAKGRYDEGEGLPGHPGHKEDGTWDWEITRSALAQNSWISGD